MAESDSNGGIGEITNRWYYKLGMAARNFFEFPIVVYQRVRISKLEKMIAFGQKENMILQQELQRAKDAANYWQNLRDPKGEIEALYNETIRLKREYEEKITTLRKELARYRGIFSEGPCKIMVVGRDEFAKKDEDKEGVILEVNGVKLMSGDTIPELGSKMYQDYATKHKGKKMYEELKKCMRTGAREDFPRVNYNNQKYLDITIVPMANGECVIFSRDIGEVPKEEYILDDSALSGVAGKYEC